jgi:hypothetical protein
MRATVDLSVGAEGLAREKPLRVNPQNVVDVLVGNTAFF